MSNFEYVVMSDGVDNTLLSDENTDNTGLEQNGILVCPPEPETITLPEPELTVCPPEEDFVLERATDDAYFGSDTLLSFEGITVHADSSVTTSTLRFHMSSDAVLAQDNSGTFTQFTAAQGDLSWVGIDTKTVHSTVEGLDPNPDIILAPFAYTHPDGQVTKSLLFFDLTGNTSLFILSGPLYYAGDVPTVEEIGQFMLLSYSDPDNSNFETVLDGATLETMAPDHVVDFTGDITDLISRNFEALEGSTGTDGSTEPDTSGGTDGSTEPDTSGGTDGSTEPDTFGGSDGSTEPDTSGGTDGSTEPDTSSGTDGSTERDTSGSTDGSTEPDTSGSTDGSTEPDTAGEKDEDSDDGDENNRTPSVGVTTTTPEIETEGSTEGDGTEPTPSTGGQTINPDPQEPVEPDPEVDGVGGSLPTEPDQTLLPETETETGTETSSESEPETGGDTSDGSESEPETGTGSGTTSTEASGGTTGLPDPDPDDTTDPTDPVDPQEPEITDPEPSTEVGTGFNYIWGTDRGEFIEGTLGDDYISALGGNDTVFGRDGDDVIFGDSGDDHLFGEQGSDSIWASDGDDYVDGGAEDDLIGGGHGQDTLYGNDGQDVIYKFSGTGFIGGGSGDDLIIGGYQRDTLLSGEGNDVVVGDLAPKLGGSDIIEGGAGDDLLYGGDGSDEFRFNPNHGMDTIASFEFGLLFNDQTTRDALHLGRDWSVSDVIHLSGFDGLSEANILSYWQQSGSNVVFEAQGTQITLVDVSLDDLSSDNFLFS